MIIELEDREAAQLIGFLSEFKLKDSIALYMKIAAQMQQQQTITRAPAKGDGHVSPEPEPRRPV